MGTLFGPKPKPPPHPPGLDSTLQPMSSFIGPTEGTVNSTFITGNNKAPQIAGGKKTLLGGA